MDTSSSRSGFSALSAAETRGCLLIQMSYETKVLACPQWERRLGAELAQGEQRTGAGCVLTCSGRRKGGLVGPSVQDLLVIAVSKHRVFIVVVIAAVVIFVIVARGDCISLS